MIWLEVTVGSVMEDLEGTGPCLCGAEPVSAWPAMVVPGGAILSGVPSELVSDGGSVPLPASAAPPHPTAAPNAAAPHIANALRMTISSAARERLRSIAGGPKASPSNTLAE